MNTNTRQCRIHGIFLFILAICLGFWTSAWSDPLTLLDESPTPILNDAQHREYSQPIVKRSRFVTIQGEDLEQANSLDLRLFEDKFVTVDVDRVEKRGPQRYTWFGKIPEDPLGYVILLMDNGKLTGDLMVNMIQYEIRPLGKDGSHIVTEIDPDFSSDHEFCTAISDNEDASTPDLHPFSPLATDSSDSIDVMVVYTDDVLAEVESLGQNIDILIQKEVDKTNQSYINSGITQRIRLVHAKMVKYFESGIAKTDAINIVSKNDGILDEVHGLRDQYKADLVSLWVIKSDLCGIGRIMTSSEISSSFSDKAFSVVKHSTFCSIKYTFSHELGHNMGATHDRYAVTNLPEFGGPGAYDYSYGYVSPKDFPGAGFRTIMAYDDQCNAENRTCQVIQNWSNPDQIHEGQSTGIADSADNRKTLNNTA